MTKSKLNNGKIKLEDSGKEVPMKVLIFDIENAPNVVYTWGRYEQDVIDVVEDWYILSFSYKWLGSKTSTVRGLPNFSLFKSDKHNDRELVKELWRLFDEADVIVAHNGNSFDIKKCRARFLFHGMKPPSPFKSIDTKLVAKRYFRFDSNKLDELGRQLGLGRKVHHDGFEMWKGCMAGEMKWWKKMLYYNKQDVALLEKVYLKLRPYIEGHPNSNVFNGTSHNCPNCGSVNTHRRGTATTRTLSYSRFQCQDCGSWSRGSVEKKVKVIVR